MPYSPPKTGSFSRGKLFIIALWGHFILQRSNAVLWGNQKQGRTKVTTVFPCVSFLEPQKRNDINVFIWNVRNQHTGASVTRLLPTLTARAILGKNNCCGHRGCVHKDPPFFDRSKAPAHSGCLWMQPGASGRARGEWERWGLASDSLLPCCCFPREGSFASSGVVSPALSSSPQVHWPDRYLYLEDPPEKTRTSSWLPRGKRSLLWL